MPVSRMVQRGGFWSRISLDKALALISSSVRSLPTEEIPFHESAGRVLGEDVVAEANVPPFDRAAVDGYAVVAEDTFGATQGSPRKLRVSGSVVVGSAARIRIGREEAVRVDTGAPLPRGADAVVMAENVAEEGRYVHVFSPVTPGKNVSRAGEDVRAGEVVLRRGRVIRPPDVGLLASIGRLRVRAYRRPEVGIISTGRELVDPGSRRSQPAVVDANSYSLSAAVCACGGVPHRLGIVPDDRRILKRRIAEALKRDAVIISGGSAAGRMDLAPEVVAEMGEVKFHGVAMRPGGPSAFGIVDEKPVFCLAGFPAGALVAFDMLVRPALRRMQGLGLNRGYPRLKARLGERMASTLGRTDVVRVRLAREKNRIVAYPIRITGSSMLSTITNADGFVVIPEHLEGLERGDMVEVELYDGSQHWLQEG
ncbi:MAG: molybdopterin molybdotransferase MoeA [Candidatus Hadarchaeales archaeon]